MHGLIKYHIWVLRACHKWNTIKSWRFYIPNFINDKNVIRIIFFYWIGNSIYILKINFSKRELEYAKWYELIGIWLPIQQLSLSLYICKHYILVICLHRFLIYFRYTNWLLLSPLHKTEKNVHCLNYIRWLYRVSDKTSHTK